MRVAEGNSVIESRVTVPVGKNADAVEGEVPEERKVQGRMVECKLSNFNPRPTVAFILVKPVLTSETPKSSAVLMIVVLENARDEPLKVASTLTKVESVTLILHAVALPLNWTNPSVDPEEMVPEVQPREAARGGTEPSGKPEAAKASDSDRPVTELLLIAMVMGPVVAESKSSRKLEMDEDEAVNETVGASNETDPLLKPKRRVAWTDEDVILMEAVEMCLKSVVL